MCANWFSWYRFDAEVKVFTCLASNDRVKSRLKAALSESNAGLDEIIKTFEIVDAANSVEEVIKLRGRWCHRPGAFRDRPPAHYAVAPVLQIARLCCTVPVFWMTLATSLSLRKHSVSISRCQHYHSQVETGARRQCAGHAKQQHSAIGGGDTC